jgi:L,D-peptidoglycan transpeptidase YkuD (ErfK/YbiS/YcfS/YnhG family)
VLGTLSRDAGEGLRVKDVPPKSLSPALQERGDSACQGWVREGGAARLKELSRRGLLLLPVQLAMVRLSEAAQTEYETLEYRDGQLYWSRGSVAAVIGWAGVKASKHEGDGATPAGNYPLVSVLYRPDRLTALSSHLPVRPIAPNDGWVDDPADANYNQLVPLPYPASAERMWREDELYDALVVIGYNMDPVVPGAGSAIFLHIASPGSAPTAGCVAVNKQVLLGLLPLLGPGSKITIKE